MRNELGTVIFFYISNIANLAIELFTFAPQIVINLFKVASFHACRGNYKKLLVL